MEIVKRFRFAVKFKSMVVEDERLLVISALEFHISQKTVISGLQTYSNDPISYGLAGWDFTSLQTTQETIYFISKTTVHAAQKIDFNGFDRSGVYFVCDLRNPSVFTTFEDMLIVADKKAVTFYKGAEKIKELVFSSNYGIISCIKVIDNCVLISTEAGSIIKIFQGLDREAEEHIEVLIEKITPMISFVVVSDTFYYTTMEAENFRLSNGKTTVEFSEFPLDLIATENRVYVQFKKNICILDRDLVEIEQFTSKLTIEKMVLFKEKLFIAYNHGLIEEYQSLV